MRRREFLGLAGGAMIGRPALVRAESPAMPMIGFLSSRSASDSVRMLDGFRKGLVAAGLIEGENVAVTYRWAAGQYDRLPGLAAELVGSPISVLVAVGGEPRKPVVLPVRPAICHRHV